MEDVIRKIKNLMAKANNAAATQAEAEAALARAFDMLAKHNISMGDLEKGDGADREHMGEHPWNQRWQKIVWQAVADLYFCEFYFVGRGTKSHEFYLVGRAANRITAQSVAQFVVDTGNKAAREFARGNEGNSVSLSNNFKKGFAHAIHVKAGELKAAAKAGENTEIGNALMVLDVYETTAVENAAFMGNIGTDKSKSKYTDRSAVQAGIATGSNVSLSPSVTGSKGPRAIAR